MNKREFIRRILMGSGVVAAAGIPLPAPAEKPEVVNLSGPLQCGGCGDMLFVLTRTRDIIELGYVHASCARCQKAWKIPLKSMPVERIPYAPV